VQRSTGSVQLSVRLPAVLYVTTATGIFTLALGPQFLRVGYRVAHLFEPFERKQSRGRRLARLAGE
jgi:hypothetical protein